MGEINHIPYCTRYRYSMPSWLPRPLSYGRGKTPGQAANPELIRALKMALAAGFRHLDLAEMYGTDEEVAAALEEACIPREELFITSKLLKSFAELENGGVKQAGPHQYL